MTNDSENRFYSVHKKANSSTTESYFRKDAAMRRSSIAPILNESDLFGDSELPFDDHSMRSNSEFGGSFVA